MFSDIGQIQTAGQQPSAPAAPWPLSSNDPLALPSDGHPFGRDCDLPPPESLARMAYSVAPDFAVDIDPPALRTQRAAALAHARTLTPALPSRGTRADPLTAHGSPPSARSRFVQASTPQMWTAMPPNAAAIPPVDPPPLQSYGALDTGIMYDDPAPTHPLNLDLTRQLDAASCLPPPTSPWNQISAPQYPATGLLNAPLSSSTRSIEDDYAYDYALEQARAAQVAFVPPQLSAGDRPRNRSYSVFSGDSTSLSNAGGAPTASDLLAARLGQISISGQADTRRPVARRQTTATNTAPPQGLDALRTSNELLAAVLRATPATSGSIVGGSANPGANWSGARPGGPAPLWSSPDAATPLDHTHSSAAREGAYESSRALPAPLALLADLLPQDEKPAPTSTRSYRVSEHGPTPSGQRKVELYKTELCRKWSEKGSCRYGTKCQFAHGAHELRPVERHHLYKTQVCRTFASTGVCPYSYRCCFIHPEPPATAASQEAGKTFPSTAAACTQSKVAAAGADLPRGVEERQRHRSGSKPHLSHRAHGRRARRNSSSPSAAGAAASASAAVSRLHEALNHARIHPGSASVSPPEHPDSPKHSPSQRRPRARSQQSLQPHLREGEAEVSHSGSHAPQLHPVRPGLNPLGAKDSYNKQLASSSTVGSAGSASSGSLGSWTSTSAVPTVPTAPGSPTKTK